MKDGRWNLKPSYSLPCPFPILLISLFPNSPADGTDEGPLSRHRVGIPNLLVAASWRSQAGKVEGPGSFTSGRYPVAAIQMCGY